MGTFPKLIPALMVMTVAVMITFCGRNERGESAEGRAGRTVVPTHTVQILSEMQDRVVAEVRVALAQTEKERNMGLMDVHQMPFDTGMYFIFPDETPRSFWMVNTPLSLDILFINKEKRIVRIHTRTTPFSDRQIRSEFPAMYTLEVNAGFVSEFDIREGMHVRLQQNGELP